MEKYPRMQIWYLEYQWRPYKGINSHFQKSTQYLPILMDTINQRYQPWQAMEHGS